jgi:SAM-dependent methyltransferase
VIHFTPDPPVIAGSSRLKPKWGKDVMMSHTWLPPHERVGQLMDQLGIARAHFGGRHPSVIGDLLSARPDLVVSATLVCPPAFDAAPFWRLHDRLLGVLGDSGPAAAAAWKALKEVPEATTVALPGYEQLPWSDLVADRPDHICDALTALLDRVSERGDLVPVSLPEGEGEVAGVSYRTLGAGPPLVLFPLGLAPSQWEPLLRRLSDRYCTIVLGGAYLGIVASLEERGRTRGYRGLVGGVVDALNLRPGQHVLEVGCGSGVLCRWLARRTNGANVIAGVDINRYLLREAAALATREELADQIDFREGDAEALPFADASFDVVLSVTMLEEVDADRALAELVRVAKPGGRVGVVVRAADAPFWYNLPLPPELKGKAERVTGPGAGPLGCADGSLFGRVQRAGLADARAWLQMATFYPAQDSQEFWGYYQNWVVAVLTAEEATTWRRAVSHADADGTFYWAMPHHCAVGTKV